MDRGMASEDNVAFLQEGQRRYIIGTPKSMLKRFEQQILAGDWQTVHEGLEVQLCTSPAGDQELFILCRSAARRQKEEEMHQRFIERLKQGLVKLEHSCEAGRVKNLGTLERRIGRLLEKNSRAAALFDIHASEDATTHHLQLQWTIRQDRKTWAQLSEGCYLLRTNIRDWSGEDLWRAYIQLTEVEAAFRIHKSDLQLRPIWHQKSERVQAHILVCFLAYVLWKCLAQLCHHAGLGDEPRKVIDEIRQLKLVDVILPTRHGHKIRLRCVSKPEPALQILLQRLHLTPPERLKQNHIL
jgi:transposase